MAYYAKEVICKSYPYFEMTTSLESNYFSLVFRWSERESCFYFDLMKNSGEVIRLGTKILPKEKIFYTDDLTDYGLTGFFILLPKSYNYEYSNTYDYKNFTDKFLLFYIYE